MAITATQYIDIGHEMFKTGSPRPVGESWQAKAQQLGWDEAYTGAHGSKYLDYSPTAKPIPGALPDVTAIHIASLIHRATNAEPRLAQRLMNKANALQAKWRNRAVARTLREARA